VKKQKKSIFINANSILFFNKVKSIQFNVDVRTASGREYKECFAPAFMCVVFDDGSFQEYLVLKSDIYNIKNRIDMGYASVAFTDKYKPMMDQHHKLIVELKDNKGSNAKN